jgi:hypothetical protein
MKQESLALECASPHYDFKCTKELARRAPVSGRAISKFSDVGTLSLSRSVATRSVCPSSILRLSSL